MSEAAPRVWVLLGPRVGDNAQLLALAEGLGWPFETRRMTYRRSELATNLVFDATRLGISRRRSSPLAPPWPDLVLSAGRRSEPIARWIRRASGGATKCVHLGRPWRRPSAFDLVIVTPQYPVTTQPGVLQNLLPLHRVTPERLTEAAALHRARLASLPRPWIGVFLGGSSELFSLGASAGARLARETSALARATGGSLLVTTSARTPARALAAFRATLDAPAEVHVFRPDDAANPYLAYLALADRFIVTGDSVSMLTDACATRKPIEIFDPGRSRPGWHDPVAAVRRRVFHFGVPRLGRDIRRLHDELARRGLARPLGAAAPAATATPPDALERSVSAVRTLCAAALRERSDDAADEPRVWAVLSYRAGENAQILALAEALGWPFEVKRLAYRRFGRVLDVFRGTTLAGIDRRRSSPLGPPWPTLVISASMRNEPVCRWIRDRSGGRARLVHLGKPWARLESFDLLVTVPEYPIPPHPNVLHNACCLHRVTPNRLDEAARRWAPALADLPRPLLAVLVGGYAGPYALDRERAERLGRETSAMARKRGGALLVTTSARTPRAACDALCAAIDAPHVVFRWRPDATENPYLGFLALADEIVVTSDSTAMVAEACATRKPVHLFDLGRDEPSQAPATVMPETWTLRRALRRLNADRFRAFAYRHVMLRFRPRNLVRDISVFHRAVVEAGRAVWLGDPPRAGRPPPFDEMPRTVARVRAFVGASRSGHEHGGRAGGQAPRGGGHERTQRRPQRVG